MSAVWTRPLVVAQDEDFSLILGFGSFQPGASIATSIPDTLLGTGCSGVLVARETSAVASSLILSLTGTFSVPGGLAFGTSSVNGISVATITITIPNATTLNLPVGQWYYDCKVSQGSLNRFYLSGDFIVQPTVAR